jgi:hypothetical protein
MTLKPRIEPVPPELSLLITELLNSRQQRHIPHRPPWCSLRHGLPGAKAQRQLWSPAFKSKALYSLPVGCIADDGTDHHVAVDANTFCLRRWPPRLQARRVGWWV